MYEGVAVVKAREGAKLQLTIAAHNMVEKTEVDKLVTYLKQDGYEAFIFAHTLFHPGDCYVCPNCHAALEEKAKIVHEERERENAHRRGSPPPFDVRTPGPALVVDPAKRQPPSPTPSESLVP